MKHVRGLMIVLLASTPGCITAVNRIGSRDLSAGGVPPQSRLSAIPARQGTFRTSLSDQQTSIPRVGTGYSISGKLEAFLLDQLSMSFEGDLSFALQGGNLFSPTLVGRWHQQFIRDDIWVAPYLSTSYLFGKLTLSGSEDGDEMGSGFVRQKMSGAVLEPGATISWQAMRWLQLSLGYGFQLAWMRLNRPCYRYESYETYVVSKYCRWPGDQNRGAWKDELTKPYWNNVIGVAVHFGTTIRGYLSAQLSFPNAMKGMRYPGVGAIGSSSFIFSSGVVADVGLFTSDKTRSDE